MSHYKSLKRKDRDEELSKTLLFIKNNIEYILSPAYVQYTKEDSMSAIDPSYIYSKTYGDIRKPKLTNRKPRLKEGSDRFYEYGFDKEGNFLYQKVYTQEDIFYSHYYVYLDEDIYCIEVNRSCNVNMDYKNVTQFEYFISAKYQFENGKIQKIFICNNGYYGERESYQWLNEDVAIVKEGMRKYILIKDKDEVLIIATLEYGNTSHQKFSYQSQCYIDLDSYIIQASKKINHSSLDIEYGYICDINKKVTEYNELKLLNRIYIVYINYMKAPKDFSYKKAKEIYKKEIMDYIEKRRTYLDYEVCMIGIQYGNWGYSMMDIIIGLDKGNNEDVQSMSDCVDFSFENRELISMLDDYIKIHGYYQSFHRFMKSMKKELEDKYQVPVILDEIID